MHDEAHGTLARTGPEEPAGGDIRAALDAVLADRSGPEARALFTTLSTYVERRANQRVRARYAELVKRWHPDSNGGDRGAEENLQRVIKAYQTLKSGGLG